MIPLNRVSYDMIRYASMHAFTVFFNDFILSSVTREVGLSEGWSIHIRHAHTFAATASDDDSSDGEDGTGLVQGVDEEGMQVAIRNGDEPAEQSDDEEGEGEEMEVLDPSHVSSTWQANVVSVFVCSLANGLPILSSLSSAADAKGATSFASPAHQAE